MPTYDTNDDIAWRPTSMCEVKLDLLSQEQSSASER